MASIFVVIFTTMLVTIITLSFISIILSESTQTTNSNLSQSAYDSAMVGIEDAKIAIMTYQECISKGERSAGLCGSAVESMEKHNIRNPSAPRDCDVVGKSLKRPTGNTDHTGEVFIQAETLPNGQMVDQYYTCVLLSEENPDYLSELRSDYRTKLVPIRVAENNVNKIHGVKVEWFTAADITSEGQLHQLPGVIYRLAPNPLSGGLYQTPNKSGLGTEDSGLFFTVSTFYPLAPPTIRFQFVQTAPTFNLDSLNLNYQANRTNNGALFLIPASGISNAIPNNSTIGEQALAVSADKADTDPVPINCNTNFATSDYLCSVNINLPWPNTNSATVLNRNQSTSFFMVSLPYGMPNTTFSLTLYDKDGKTIDFVGVQARVDSTGRANDLFRRVEARIEMADIHFPLPEFALQLSDGSSDLTKNYWVTTNNWLNGDINSGVTSGSDLDW